VVEDRSGCITILVTYSPPKHIIKKEQYINFFKTLGYRFIAAGDCNAKHTHWGSRLILPKGCKLLKAIKVMKPYPGKPTYWPSDYKKTFDLLDFSIIKSIPKDYSRIESYLELSSDYSPVIFIINSKIMPKSKPCTLCIVKTEWPYFQELLKTILDNSILLKIDDDITS